MKRAPLLYALLPLMGGILVAFSFTIPLIVVLLLAATALLSLAATAFVHWFRYQGTAVAVGAVVTLFFALGMALPPLHNPLNNDRHYLHLMPDDSDCVMQLRLVENPVERERSYRVVANVEYLRLADSMMVSDGRLALYLPKDSLAPTLRYGDILVGDGRLTLPAGESNPYQFNYRTYLARRGVLRQTYLANYRKAGHRSGGLTHWSKQLQYTLVERMRHARLTPSQTAIAEAMLLGWRSDLDDLTYRQFQDAGIAHLLCVSGLHVGIIAAIAGAALYRQRRRRWAQITRGIMQLAAVWLFVLISGMAPGTSRAAIMFSLFIVAQIIGRDSNRLNTLAASALLLLCCRPALLFDTSFQLSHSAVLGIITLYNPLVGLIKQPQRRNSRGWRKKAIARARQFGLYLWRLVCLSTAAQAATLPFVLYHFHRFPLYFLVANTVVLPFVGLLTTTMLLLLIVLPWAWLATPLTSLLATQLLLLDKFTAWISHLPASSIYNIYCDFPAALLWAAAVAALAFALNGKRRQLYIFPTVSLVLALCRMALVDVRATHLHQWIVYKDKRHTAIELFDRRQSLLLSDSATCANPAMLDFSSRGLLIHNRTNSRHIAPYNQAGDYGEVVVQPPFILWHGKTIAVIDAAAALAYRNATPSDSVTHIDCLILSGKPYISPRELERHLDCDTVIITAHNYSSMARLWHNRCVERRTPLIDHFMQEAQLLR